MITLAKKLIEIIKFGIKPRFTGVLVPFSRAKEDFHINFLNLCVGGKKDEGLLTLL